MRNFFYEKVGDYPKSDASTQADRLGVTTDCGLILLQRYITQDKLHALVEGTKLVRERLRHAVAAE